MKGMQKIRRGTGFRGLIDYSLDHDSGHIIGGNMSSTTARGLAAEFKSGRMQRPDISKPVWHNSLRLPAGDHLPDEKWQAVAHDYMRQMGFADDHQYVLIKHAAEDGEHVHIIANRVSLTGQVYLGQNENLVSTKVVAKLEQLHKLAITATAQLDEKTGLPSTKSNKKKLKRGEIEKALSTGLKPPRLRVQEFLDRALDECAKNPGKYNLSDLARACARNGITLKPYVDAASGEVRGVSFECEGQVFSGSQLGENYKFRNLTERMRYGNKVTESLAAAERVRNDGTRQKLGAANLTDGASDRPSAIRAPANPADRAGRQDQGDHEMRNPFKRKPTPVAPAPVAPIAPVINSIGVPSTGPLSRPSAPPPPSLGGKLIPIRKSDGTFDLMFRESDRPTFNWSGEPHQVKLLGQASPKNISVLFDLAKEKGIGMPLIQITGTPEFQTLAVMEAAARGIPVDTQKLHEEARQAYQIALDSQPMDNCIANAAAAYESADRAEAERQRQQEANREKNADRADDRNDQRMKMG